MKIAIFDGKQSAFNFRERLREMGFWYVKMSDDLGQWQRNVYDEEIADIERFCQKYKLRYIVYDDGYVSDADYRDAFFENNHGLLDADKFYQCAYCGMIIPKKSVVVSHIISPYKLASGDTRKKYTRKLAEWGIEDVNDVRNLAPACQNCFQNKGVRAGAWAVRGKLGRHPLFWFVAVLLLSGCIALIIIHIGEIFTFLFNQFTSRL